MSPRPAHRRTGHQHDLKAAEVLRRYQAKRAWTPSLPIPVEDIVEYLFGLRLVWQVIPEPPGHAILGALDPAARQMVLNESRLHFFEQVVGPERFTLAHELGHWLYDADDPDQQVLFGRDGDGIRYCRDKTHDGLSEVERVRERNADAFAARLLLPADLLRAELPPGPSDRWPIREMARTWGVSRRTLEIRLEELAIL